jgi:hypothetical protein
MRYRSADRTLLLSCAGGIRKMRSSLGSGEAMSGAISSLLAVLGLLGHSRFLDFL